MTLNHVWLHSCKLENVPELASNNPFHATGCFHIKIYGFSVDFRWIPAIENGLG